MSITIEEAFNNPETREAVRQLVHQDLTERAFQIVTGNLEKYGNKLGKEHKTALIELVGGFTLMAYGIRKGRYAYPLPTGMGKTQSIVAWCAALVELKKEASVAVAASKVEALCQLKRDLILNGVPEGLIGLIHSYKHNPAKVGEDGYASEPSTKDNESRPILLVTHSRVHFKENLKQFNTYNGKPRNLIIWDESLLVSDSRSVTLLSIRQAIGHRAPVIGDDTLAVQYITNAVAAFEAEITRQKDGQSPQLIHLPPLSLSEMATIKDQIGLADVQEPLREFLKMSQEPLRITHTEQGGGLITYEITLPRELENIAILDASYPIRELEKMDKTIQLGGKFSKDMKRYDKVTINHLKSPSGRGSMTRDFSNPKMEGRRVSSEVCKLISGLPEDEGVIIFTFKEREGTSERKKGVNFKGRLKADLQEWGVNVEAQLPSPYPDSSPTVPRLVFLTWGQETSLSQYSYCKHVVFAGVLHRSHLDLASCIVGQTDNLLQETSSSRIREVMDSEIAHNIYQALSRGSCRMIKANQAHKMDAWLIHGSDTIRPLLQTVMPGMKWQTWNGSFLTSTNSISQIVGEIKEYLEMIPYETNNKSVTAMKKEAGLNHVPESSFTLALHEALNSEDVGWKRQNRSLVRKTIQDYFNLATSP